MNTRWQSIGRRRSMVMAGVVAALLASGGVAAAAATGGDGTAKHEGSTVSEAPGNPKPQHVEPGTAEELRDVTVAPGGASWNTGEKPSLEEVPGATLPQDWELAEGTPVEDAPIVDGDEGNTGLPPQ